MVDRVEIVLLVISIIALVNCMVRSDYNIVVGLICYFYWNSRDNNRIPWIIIAILVITIIFDIIWTIIVWNSWVSKNWASPIWNSLRGLHITVIVLSIVNMALKLAACGLVFLDREKNAHTYKEMRDENRPLHG